MPNWKDVLAEIKQRQQELGPQGGSAVDLVRRKYLQELQSCTKRNVIAYYSGFLSKPEIDSGINDEDKNGFMMAVHQLDKVKGLDLILHTPGGSIAATQSIMYYLHQIFKKDIRAFVPQIAMSAGTMIACSCKEIYLARHANLGPIDPQLRGVPARGVTLEFREACKQVRKDPGLIPVWQSIIGQYPPTFLSQCDNAWRWSNTFVREQLEEIMFEGEANAKQKARQVVRRLADYRGNKTHDRHIHYEECETIGLKVKRIEDDQSLQDLLLTVHHCFMHTLMNTSSYKIIENHRGAAFVKQQRSVVVPQTVLRQPVAPPR
ncbi:MAG: hypothetical protein A3C53_08360 [Omnitrophica WOR_2 bacterium RIFCSPHIGHO2_02_FULL_68_15]|nr:MAG: hypothetical protein A3C53_08360 [Omnitrophica WOR_2 bacterium RIFCSPHIGHO2_02_FULL_68_15]